MIAGTAACPNGKFYCRNVWFVPQILNSSFVDDGVCGKMRATGSSASRPLPLAAYTTLSSVVDCCDGTDEPTGKCGNTCKQKGEEALSGLTAELAEAEAGLVVRRKYVKYVGQLN